MKIEGTTFGAITIDGKTYDHDVVVRLSGEIIKRKKKLSKRLSHAFGRRGKVCLSDGMRRNHHRLRQMGNVHLSPEAKAYFEKHGCKVLLKPTAEAITAFNRSHGKKVGLFHVTC